MCLKLHMMLSTELSSRVFLYFYYRKSAFCNFTSSTFLFFILSYPEAIWAFKWQKLQCFQKTLTIEIWQESWVTTIQLGNHPFTFSFHLKSLNLHLVDYFRWKRNADNECCHSTHLPLFVNIPALSQCLLHSYNILVT